MGCRKWVGSDSPLLRILEARQREAFRGAEGAAGEGRHADSVLVEVACKSAAGRALLDEVGRSRCPAGGKLAGIGYSAGRGSSSRGRSGRLGRLSGSDRRGRGGGDGGIGRDSNGSL